jgi:twitching motility protein PilT
VHGELRYLQADRMRPGETRSVAEILLTHARHAEPIEDVKEYDMSYAVSGIGRYRVNIYRTKGTLAIAMRSISLRIPGFEELRLPPMCRALAEIERGMVLVVGAAGNGKSTTLAAMLGHLNQTRRIHIVTIEDPIEYIHTDQLASVSQREIGIDTPDFATALRAALRQDPDVILVGEVRDEETMDIALKSAETGHLVLSTLHTPDVQRTVGRVLALTGGNQSQETRERFGENLKGIIAQRLLPRQDGQGIVIATEALMVTGTARETIRKPEGNPPLKEVMEKGVHPYGMHTFEMSLRELVKQGLISVDAARAAMG